jgi:hypothetical protein
VRPGKKDLPRFAERARLRLAALQELHLCPALGSLLSSRDTAGSLHTLLLPFSFFLPCDVPSSLTLHKNPHRLFRANLLSWREGCAVASGRSLLLCKFVLIIFFFFLPSSEAPPVPSAPLPALLFLACVCVCGLSRNTGIPRVALTSRDR